MLLYFILGILFISLGIPILDAFSSIVSAWSQYIVYIFAFKIYNIKIQMNLDDQEEEQEKQILSFTNLIGEQVPHEEELIEQEQDE